MKEQKYKVKVNKILIKEFFTTDPTKECLDEVTKVINIILAKYYSKYWMWFDELRQIAVYAITIRREQYDITKDAYNYIYTVFRNEIGNKIISMSKETPVDEFLSHQSKVYDIIDAELPIEVSRYKDYFTGEKKFEMERIPNKDIIPLMFFARQFDSIRTRVPEFIVNCPRERIYII